MSESISERIQADLAGAMKARDADTVSTLRMLKAALLELRTSKAKGAAVSADEEVEVLMRYVKKRREVIEELRRIGRTETVAREEHEIAITQRYLPAMVSEDELRGIVRAAVAQTGAASPKDMGKVIGAVMAQVKGRAEGAVVSRLVKEALAV
jgi:uncharacterized protein YqeY